MITKESWLKSILAGLFIGIGGIAYLSVENKVVGAALFAVGLFTICTLGYNLYTGKLCYILDSDKKGSYLVWLIQIWVGNLIGTAIFCNLLIYIAVENYKNNPHPLGKYMGIMMGVIVFIVAGFEHCVANMFYFSVANAWSLHTCLYLLIMTLGNLVGGVLPELAKKCWQK